MTARRLPGALHLQRQEEQPAHFTRHTPPRLERLKVTGELCIVGKGRIEVQIEPLQFAAACFKLHRYPLKHTDTCAARVSYVYQYHLIALDTQTSAFSVTIAHQEDRLQWQA